MLQKLNPSAPHGSKFSLLTRPVSRIKDKPTMNESLELCETDELNPLCFVWQEEVQSIMGSMLIPTSRWHVERIDH